LIYHLLWWLRDVLTHKIGFYAYQDVLFRAILAALTSLAVAVLIAPKVIRWLMRMKIGDRPEFHHAALNKLMQDRANTPTMGGIIILSAVLIGTFLWARLDNPFIRKAIFIVIWYGGIGAVDDWLKLTSHTHQRNRDGLKAWEKLVFQFGGAVLIGIFLYSDFRFLEDARRLWLPFYKHGIPGLASGCLGIVSTVLVVLCYIASEKMSRSGQNTWAGYLLLPHVPKSGELAIFFASITGAILGFLWYNCHPAQVFMGDVGSLPLGAAMGYGAIVTRNEILLLLIGGVFVIELLSVILQVGYFKYSGGTRIFKCAPIHHHFHLSGWSEPQIVVRFWLLSIAFAIIALATLKLR
jgi:phospho-N-acetylmuramoyl-pentapeptide-transferase